MTFLNVKTLRENCRYLEKISKFNFYYQIADIYVEKPCKFKKVPRIYCEHFMYFICIMATIDIYKKLLHVNFHN